MKKYNKLVRDNILEIIEKNNQKCTFHIGTEEEYKNKLLEKLQEETEEFILEKNEEEMADILEVIDSLIEAFNLNKEKIFQIKENKIKKNGAFKRKIILEEVF